MNDKKKPEAKAPPASHKGGHERRPGQRVEPDAKDPEAGATNIGRQPNHEDEMEIPHGTGNSSLAGGEQPLADVDSD